MDHRIRTIAVWTLLIFTAGVAPLLSGCSTNAATGRRQLDYLSRDDEIALGEEALPQLTQEYGGEIPDPAINQYINGVAMRMIEHTEADYRTMPWKVTVLNSNVINAFALPGGKIFISRALAEKFTTEAQLAGVLGHEIGHVTAEHADRMISRQIGLQVLAGIGGILAGNDAAMQQAVGLVVDAGGTFALKFSRDQENESDMLGMRYMTAAGYHPKGMKEVMQVLADASEGAGAPPEWQSTHPSPRTRIGIISDRLESDAYRQRIARGDLQEYEARFRTEFLDRIRRIPNPPSQRASELDLSNSVQWCAHCAGREALAAAWR